MAARSRLILPAAFWLGVAAAALILWVSGQAANAWDETRGARVVPLVLVVACGVLLPLIHALRWQIVMSALDTDLPLALAADLTVSASLVNYASPGYLGAPAKAFLANRTAQAPYGRSLLSMAFEQGLDFLVLLAGSAIALVILGPDRLSTVVPDVGRTAQVALAILVVVVGAASVIAGRKRAQRVAARIAEAFRTLGDRVDRRAVAMLTFAYWLAQVTVVGLLLWALRLPVSVTSTLALATIPLLAGQLAPLPGGIGAREAAIVALSGATGASAAGLLGLAVLQRVLLVAALPLALGLVRATRLLGPGGAR